jgi:hypothetical protein
MMPTLLLLEAVKMAMDSFAEKRIKSECHKWHESYQLPNMMELIGQKFI